MQHLRAQPEPWNVRVCAAGVPAWAVDELGTDSDRPPDGQEQSIDAQARCTSRGVEPELPAKAPSLTSAVREIERLRAEELSPEIFAEHYTATGVPVVLVGAFTDPVQREAIKRSRKQECQDVDCAHDVTVCDREACETAARMPPRSVPRCIDAPASSFVMPALFSGEAEGHKFGGPTHFDHACDQSLSVQWTGLKRWTLWNPWPISTADGSTLQAFSRMTTVLGPGDALWFAPGSFHTTEILEAPSIAAAHFVVGEPVYDALATTPWARSPFGYATCRWRDAGWREEQQRERRRLRLAEHGHAASRRDEL